VRRLALCALPVLAFGALLASDAPARWLVLEDAPAKVDAALVLGGDSWWERTTLGVTLVQSGQAGLLVLAGSDAPPGEPDFEAKALELGIPPALIRVERRAGTTRESLLAVAPLLRAEGVRSVALVTSRYHQRRAFLAARKALPGVTILPAAGGKPTVRGASCSPSTRSWPTTWCAAGSDAPQALQ
jgi:uncharacterized SAM-binding protein YcdF (DUF218 family)